MTIVWIIADESVVVYLGVSYFCVVFAVNEKVKLTRTLTLLLKLWMSFSFFWPVIQAVVAGAPEKLIVLQSNLHFTVQLFFSARNISGPKLSFIQCIQTLVTVQFSREKKTLQSNVKQFKDEEKNITFCVFVQKLFCEPSVCNHVTMVHSMLSLPRRYIGHLYFMYFTLHTNCKTSSRLKETTLCKPNKH